MKSNKYILYLLVLALSFFLSGCVITGPCFTNFTKREIERNPSGVYTISMSPCIRGDKILSGCAQAYIVIDGEKHCMEESCLGSNVWDYAYKAPRGHTKARYYFIYEYQGLSHGHVINRKCVESDLYCLDIVSQYVISMVSDRAPVGSKIAIVGEGFTQYDRIVVGNMEAETKFCSKNSLEFIVPALEAGQTYPVYLRCGRGDVYIGELLIDASEITVTPDAVCVNCREKTVLLFSIDREAPCGGLFISVETDIPQSVIMPEVVIPAGSRTVNVPLEGGCPAEGRLYISAPGYKEVVLPITVQ